MRRMCLADLIKAIFGVNSINELSDDVVKKLIVIIKEKERGEKKESDEN